LQELQRISLPNRFVKGFDNSANLSFIYYRYLDRLNKDYFSSDAAINLQQQSDINKIFFMHPRN
jgi:hypothetical protein